MAEIRGGDVLHRQVIDAVRRNRLGVVHELYYDAYLVVVSAIAVDYDDDRRHGIILRDDIVMFGDDATLVRQGNVSMGAAALPRGLFSRSRLTGAEVRTLEGDRVGVVDDFVVNSISLALTGLVVRLSRASAQSVTTRIIPVKAIRAVSYDNNLVVDMNVVPSQLVVL